MVLQWVRGEEGRWYCIVRKAAQADSPCCCLLFLLHSTCHYCSYASPALCPCCKSPTAQPPHFTPRILPPLLIPTRPHPHTPHLACFLAACLVAACQDDMGPHACQRLAGGQPNAGVGACHDAHLHASLRQVRTLSSRRERLLGGSVMEFEFPLAHMHHREHAEASDVSLHVAYTVTRSHPV